MDLLYRVHNAADGEVLVPATLADGSVVNATIKTRRIEMTPANEGHGSVVFQFMGADYEAASKAFQDGDAVTMTLTGPARPEPAPVEA